MLNVAIANVYFAAYMLFIGKKEKKSYLANKDNGKWKLCRWIFIKLLKFTLLSLWLLYVKETGKNEPFRMTLSTVDNTDTLHLQDQHC